MQWAILAVLGLVTAGLASVATPAVAAVTPRVLLVGSWQGVSGQYPSIQAAADAARPGDWVLIGPGDYRSAKATTAGVLITTPGIHVRGMDRNSVLVDGTKPGAAAPCSSAPAL